MTEATGRLSLPVARSRGNPFLSRVAVALRAPRPLLPDEPGWTVRTETVDGVPFVRLWFRTAGCTQDRKGRCTFCDYGRGPATSGDEMVGFVRAALAAVVPLAPDATLLISPSGSMLDEREVPADARREIWRLVAATPVRSVLCETRAETVDAGSLAEIVRLLPGRRVAVELGLETWDPWTARFSVNKGLRPDSYRRAIDLIRAHGLVALTNVVSGAPFLTTAESVDDSEATVRAALAAGSSACVLFPLHVRRFTVLETLWRHGLYQPSSLWALVEVLDRLGEQAAQVSISWYRDYDRDDPATASAAALASPTTCPACEAGAFAVLDEYRAGGEPSVLAAFASWWCPCRDRWRAELITPDTGSRATRAAEAYRLLGVEVLGAPWWERHGLAVLDELG